VFSVYGVKGHVFSGTLEQMDRVRELARSRSSRTVERNEDTCQGKIQLLQQLD